MEKVWARDRNTPDSFWYRGSRAEKSGQRRRPNERHVQNADVSFFSLFLCEIEILLAVTNNRYDEKQKPYLNHLLNREALKAMNIWLSLIRFLPGDSVDLQVARNKWRKAKVFWIDFETVSEFDLLRIFVFARSFFHPLWK